MSETVAPHMSWAERGEMASLVLSAGNAAGVARQFCLQKSISSRLAQVGEESACQIESCLASLPGWSGSAKDVRASACGEMLASVGSKSEGPYDDLGLRHAAWMTGELRVLMKEGGQERAQKVYEFFSLVASRADSAMWA